MSVRDAAARRSGVPAADPREHFVRRPSPLLLPLYTLAILVSASLLFLVQPMISKAVLPLLGGSPSVWVTSMLFFQVCLLAGYGYAHVAPRWLGVRRHAMVHLVLLALSLLFLPIGLRAGWQPPASANPAYWLLALLTVSIGAPFFLLSSTAPLLQLWFARSAHASARDPYFLYAASNIGSLTALLGYPTLVEPSLALVAQRWVWSVGYLLLFALLIGCVVLIWKGIRGGAPAVVDSRAEPEAAPPSWWQRLRWVVLAMIPSSLMLGLTTYATTDIAAVPLFWVIPLAIYLISFILVFASRPPISRALVVQFTPALLIALLIFQVWSSTRIPVSLLGIHAVTLFAVAMLCHGELVASRPPAARLTEFYLWMSAGGAVGGLFNALVAPFLFDSILEYPLMLAAASAVLPNAAGTMPTRRRAVGLLFIIMAVVLLFLARQAAAVSGTAAEPPSLRMMLAAGIASAAAASLWFRFRKDPPLFAAGGLLLVIGLGLRQQLDSAVVHSSRNFFGARQVRELDGGKYRSLTHGTTTHGVQATDEAGRREPLSYYAREGPLGDVFLEGEPAAPRRVGVIGLGIGGLLAYARPGERWTYFEIDPDIERLARDRRYFTYLSDAPATVDVVLGDGRQSLSAMPDGTFDLFIVDAFSSDAIPIHLLTREAMAVYLRKLAPDGLLLLHLSNRYLTLEPVVAGLVRDAGLVGRYRPGRVPTPEQRAQQKFASHWAAVALTEADLGPLANHSQWRIPRERPGVGVWRDDFSNLLGVMKFVRK